jgi:integrase
VGRGIQKLTDKEIRNAKPEPGRSSVMLSDGGSLYLQASRGRDNNIRRSWIFRYSLAGRKPKDMGLGSLDAVDVVQAREKAREYRGLVLQGLDPIATRDAEISANIAKTAVQKNFQQCCEDYLTSHRASWKRARQADDWKAAMETHAYPHLDKNLSVADINTQHVLNVLKPIWHAQPVLAGRLRSMVENVLGFATTAGLRTGDNPARWEAHLENLLPAIATIHTTTHYAALEYQDAPTFLDALRKVEVLAARALEFLMLTGVRSRDVIDAKVVDIDEANKVWEIPDLTKTRKTKPRKFSVPLSEQALDCLKRLWATKKILGMTDDEFLFPSDRFGGRAGVNSMANVIYGMGLKGKATPHGMRATFKTWVTECTNFQWEVVEMSLAHTVGTETARSYQRGQIFQKRVAIMEAWGAYLDNPTPDSKVIPMKRA